MSWRGRRLHVDRVARPDAPAKLIALHGIGSYGRMLAAYGRLPAFADLEFIAPDLPGFGLSARSLRSSVYRDWVECATELVAAERQRDERPVVLFGVSTGGQLAYEVAARSGGGVSAVIATCLFDVRQRVVRRCLVTRPAVASSSGALRLVPWPLSALRLPVNRLTNVAAIANHTQFANLVWADPLAGSRGLSLAFVRSWLAGRPGTAPESYSGPPLLLACPEEDGWVPPLFSQRFCARLPAETRSVRLRGTGHLPLEESGLADLDRAVFDFFDEFRFW